MKPCSLGIFCGGNERKGPSACKCFGDRPDGEAVGAIVVVPVPVARIQVEIVTVVAAVGRCRPIVAVGTNIVESTTAVVTQAGGGENVAFWLNGSRGATEGRPQTAVVRGTMMIYPFREPQTGVS